MKFVAIALALFKIFCVQKIQSEQPIIGPPVLLYHGIVETYNPSQIYTISKEQIREHLTALKQAGYQTITMQQLYNLYYKKIPLPDKSFMITFDDGLKSSFEAADSILEELGFHAIMFVIPLMQEQEYPAYLSWTQLKQMQESGKWGLEAHGYNFHYLISINEKGDKADFGSNLRWLPEKHRMETLKEYENRLREDMRMQKASIEKNLPGTSVIAFAFPFGDAGQDSSNLDPNLAPAINYKVANQEFAITFGSVGFELAEYSLSSTPHLIPRLMDNGSFSVEKIITLFKKLANKDPSLTSPK